MNNFKTKTTLLVLAAASMCLAACGGGGASSSSQSRSSRSRTSTSFSYSEIEKKSYTVNVKVDGQVIDTKTVKAWDALTKPADPTVPAGKKFLGWKNTNNGGQMWNFDNEELNQVMDNVDLEPVFVDASLSSQIFEGELCPEITDTIVTDSVTGEKRTVLHGGKGMHGNTYSGGSDGKQLIYKDFDAEYGFTGIEGFDYYLDPDGKHFYDLYETDIPAGCTKTHKDVDYTACVHVHYSQGNTFTFELESDKAAENVTLFARFSAEYGKQDEAGNYDSVDAFTDEQFPIYVNDQKVKYGSVVIHNIYGNTGAKLVYGQDFYIGNISLKQGKNVIKMVIDNNSTLNGTIDSSAPIIDNISLYSSSSITWPKAKYTNLLKDPE